jgi:hypothetical protein
VKLVYSCEMTWFKGFAPDCDTTDLGSNPAPPWTMEALNGLQSGMAQSRGLASEGKLCTNINLSPPPKKSIGHERHANLKNSGKEQNTCRSS